MADRIVLVTGANGAIGRAHVEVFRRSGWRVVATDRQEMSSDGAAPYAPMDLAQITRDAGYRRARLDALVELAGGRLDCLVNNAALQRTDELQSLADGDISESFDVNAIAPMLLIRDLTPLLRSSAGSVVNILSIHATLTKPRFAAYAASKAALAGMTRALAVELSPGIRVNGVAPAAIATPMLEQGFKDPAKLDELARCHPTGSIGTPEDVAKLSLFLASSESRFLTGAIVGLDGGIGSRLHDPD